MADYDLSVHDVIYIATQIWPNLAASGICTLIVWVKLHAIHRHLKRHHDSHDNLSG